MGYLRPVQRVIYRLNLKNSFKNNLTTSGELSWGVRRRICIISSVLPAVAEQLADDNEDNKEESENVTTGDIKKQSDNVSKKLVLKFKLRNNNGKGSKKDYNHPSSSSSVAAKRMTFTMGEVEKAMKRIRGPDYKFENNKSKKNNQSSMLEDLSPGSLRFDKRGLDAFKNYIVKPGRVF